MAHKTISNNISVDIINNDGNLERVFKDRKRTNVLRSAEQKAISYLVAKMPLYITSNVLTFVGLVGSLFVFAAFLLANYFDRAWLLAGIFGLFINWFGDSLDGRIAYYRNIPRKWFGFALDVIMDWIGTVLIGLGYLVYAKNEYELTAFLFVVLYGWAMIISQLRYKITDKYTIDAGLLGPTEVRIIIATVLLIEIIFQNSIQFCAIGMCVALFIINLIDTRNLLKLGDKRDAAEQGAKPKANG